MAVSNSGSSSGVGNVGLSASSFARWLDIISGHNNLQNPQKAQLLGSSRSLRKVMSYVYTAMMVYTSTSEAGFASGAYKKRTARPIINIKLVYLFMFL